jgi:hypothetical protein
MAVGKALNKKGYYASEGGGDIAMPPLNETPAIQNAAPNPWDNESHQPQQQQHNPFTVPDELPQEVRQEMQSQEQQYEEQEQEEQQEVQEQPRKVSPQDSFKQVRDAKEKAERERDAILSQMLEMQQRMQAQQQHQQPIQDGPEEEDDFDIDSDALVEGKHVKKMNAEMKAMKKQMRQYQAQSEEVAVEARIRAQYPDFEKVVSPENVAILNERFPDIAQTLRNTPDIYNKAASAYTVIKNFGIHKDQKIENDRARAVVNSQKPRPLASVNPTQGETPLTRANAFANGMTDDLKEQLRREMFQARKAM